MKTKLFASLLGIVGAGLLFASVANADDLADVKSKGVLVVGTKVDYPPYGFRNEAGEIVGFEPDLAADVAERLGVRLELVPVVTANRMQFLRANRIDLMIATMGVNPQRERVVDIVKPLYYAGEQTVLAPKSSDLSSWSDVSGRMICGVRAASYNTDVREKGGRIVPFKDAQDALDGLKAGQCEAFVYDTTWFANVLASPEFADYTTPLPAIRPEPWGIAVDKGETNFRNFMSDVIKDWHGSGKLIELEQKWRTPRSEFLREMHEQYKG